MNMDTSSKPVQLQQFSLFDWVLFALEKLLLVYLAIVLMFVATVGLTVATAISLLSFIFPSLRRSASLTD